jgi:hypothetical protein
MCKKCQIKGKVIPRRDNQTFTLEELREGGTTGLLKTLDTDITGIRGEERKIPRFNKNNPWEVAAEPHGWVLESFLFKGITKMNQEELKNGEEY